MKSANRWRILSWLLYSAITGLLVGIAALAIALLFPRQSPPSAAETGPFRVDSGAVFDGVIDIDPPLPMPDVALRDQDGEAARLSHFRGAHTLLSFGFTHCPDVCPLTLNEFARVQSMLGEAAGDIHFVFVSVDGRRDSPAALKRYLAARKLDGITAWTGAEADVRRFGEPFGLAFEISQQGAAGGYLLNHTTGSFLLDEGGRWIKRYQFGVPPRMIAEELRGLLAA